MAPTIYMSSVGPSDGARKTKTFCKPSKDTFRALLIKYDDVINTGHLKLATVLFLAWSISGQKYDCKSFSRVTLAVPAYTPHATRTRIDYGQQSSARQWCACCAWAIRTHGRESFWPSLEARRPLPVCPP